MEMMRNMGKMGVVGAVLVMIGLAAGGARAGDGAMPASESMGDMFPIEWPYPLPVEIPNPTPEPGWDIVLFAGMVRDVQTDPPTIQVGGMRSVTITGETILVGPSGLLTVSDFETDERVAVIGAREQGGPGVEAGGMGDIVGIFIGKLEPRAWPWPQGPGDRMGGQIVAIDLAASTLTLRGKRTDFRTDENTVFVDRWTTGLSMTDLTTGGVIVARGQRSAQRDTFDANWVRLIGPRHRPDQHTSAPLRVATGFLMDKLGPGEWLLNTGATASLTPDTDYYTFPHNRTAPDGIEPGDHLRIKGIKPARESDACSITARRVNERPAAIMSIDAGAGTFVANGLTVLSDIDTEILDRRGDPLIFDDLALGDLVRLRGDFLTTDTLDATTVTVLRSAEISSPVQGLNHVPGSRGAGGRWQLRATTNTLAFGFINFPKDTLPATDGGIYRVRATLASDVADTWEVPRVRLRFAAENGQKAQLLTITSDGAAPMSPPVGGRMYEHVIVPPPVDPDVSEDLNDLFFAFDVINMDPANAERATVEILDLVVDGFEFEDVTSLETVYQTDFESGDDGWVYGSVPTVMPAAIGRRIPGALGLRPRSSHSFGYWTRSLDEVDLLAGELYRARFIIQTNAPDLADCPGFRVRMNSGGLASVTLLNSMGDAAAIPDIDGAALDTFMAVPADAVVADRLALSLDMLNLDETDDLGVEVLIDEVTLERVLLGP